MRKISILYVITKLELGGAQKQLLKLIEHLDQEKFLPFLFTAKDGLLLQEAQSITGLRLKKSRYLGRSINPLKDLLALAEIYLFIKNNKIDIVHTHSSKAGILGRWAARLAQVKIILHTVHGWSFNNYQNLLKQKIFKFLERLCARFSHKLVVVSNFDRDKGLAHHIGKAEKYCLIRYGIDYNEFDSSKYQNFKEKLGIRADYPVVGMISCFKPQKAPQDFIRAALLVNKVIPQAKFILIGDGILRRNIEKLIKKFGLDGKVILTGWRRDIPTIFSATDIYVLTSLWEGLPITVLEAMRSSLPVVVTNTGGVGEIVKEAETGFLVSPQDNRELARKVIILLKDKNLRESIGKNARARLDSNFKLTNMVNNTELLYEDLIRDRIFENVN